MMSLQGRIYFFAWQLLWTFLSLLDEIGQRLPINDIPMSYWHTLHDLQNTAMEESFFPQDQENINREEMKLLVQASEAISDFLVAHWLEYLDDIGNTIDQNGTKTTDEAVWQFQIAGHAVISILQEYKNLMQGPEIKGTEYYEQFQNEGYQREIMQLENATAQLLTNKSLDWKTIRRDTLDQTAKHLADEWQQAVFLAAKGLKVQFS